MTFLQWIGAFLILTDWKDVPKIDRLHHWQLGAALLFLGKD